MELSEARQTLAGLGADWSRGNFPGFIRERAEAIATILNAVASGDLIPKADADALADEVERLTAARDAARDLLAGAEQTRLSALQRWDEERGAILADRDRLAARVAELEAVTQNLIARYVEVVTTPDCSCSPDDYDVQKARATLANADGGKSEDL